MREAGTTDIKASWSVERSYENYPCEGGGYFTASTDGETIVAENQQEAARAIIQPSIEACGTCVNFNVQTRPEARLTVRPRIDSISPDRGPIDSTVGISIIGSGFGSGSTVSVGGTGVTGSVQSWSSTSLSVTLTIAPNATPGNHGVTVTKSGKTSNSVNLFVQVPTSLRRDSMSGLQDQQGGCGVTRSLQYTLLDQEEAPIDTNGIISEGVSNYSGPSGTQPQETSVSLIHGEFPDTVGYNYSPDCPPPFTATFTQSFTVALATQGYAWALSSQNAISMGRTSSGSKFVDLTFTP